MTPNDNSVYFLHSRRNRPVRSGPSRWLNLPREGFSARMEADKTEMSNSHEASHVSSTFILGHTGRSK